MTARNNLAATLRALGDLAGARKLHEQNLEIYERVLGSEHPNTLTTRNNLAWTLYEQGERQAARELMNRVAVSSRRVLGEEHPRTQGSIKSLHQFEDESEG